MACAQLACAAGDITGNMCRMSVMGAQAARLPLLQDRRPSSYEVGVLR
ncbi:MAG TPA: hypothetical protein VMU36_02620 [Spirochaetia bacterium]|nr:hypothetical protein [Spirochaetia bacterium]